MKEKRKRILVCDDDLGFLTVMTEWLRAQGYEPITAEAGKTCLEKFSKLSPDLLLLDFRLRDMDGREVLQELRKVEEGCSVIIMTGFGDQKLAAEVIKSGAMDYLVKPFRIEELVEAIENTLRKAEEIKKKHEQERLVSWGRLLPVVAHEIRTPLHSIGGALTLIENRCQNDETTTRAVRIIQKEILRLNQFVDQCLDFSRRPAKEGVSSIDLNEAVRSCLELIEPFLRNTGKKLEMKRRLDPSLPRAYADLDQIKQVLINLVRNAVEAIPKEGTITVETHHNRDRIHEFAEIKVIDNGIGIKEKDLAEVFSPFFSQKRKGIGLGLAICKKLVEENHQGQIRMESSPRKGTTVTVTLPISTPNSLQHPCRSISN